MEHQDSTIQLSPEERHFEDYMKRGDDFMKIEIYRRAKEWYTKALNLHINDTPPSEKLKDCQQKIKKETHTITIIAIIAVIIVAATWIVYSL